MARKQKKNIVILGAGFAGLKVAQDLSKKIDTDSWQIFLADRRNVHIYTPDLYEIAAAFNKEITNACLTELAETVATPIRNLINHRKVKFVHDHIVAIDPKKQEVKFKHEDSLKYDYLVVCLGSETNYFNIPGLKEHSFSVKTITNALAFNCHLDMFFQDLWKRKVEKDVRIVIGGGGATGVELAGELVGYIKRLSEKYHFDASKVSIELVEAGDDLVKLGKKCTKVILKRFKKQGVKAHLNTRITALNKKSVKILQDGKETSMPCDILAWTGGVKVNELVVRDLGDADCRGSIPVDVHLRSKNHENVFAAGDNALFIDPKTKKPAHMLAQIAWAEGEILAYNILASIAGSPLKKFKILKEAVIVPIGGKFAVCKIGAFIGTGWWCWALRRLVTLKYSLSIMPFFKAVDKWLHSNRVFDENDA